jgi:hypothetical protein
MESQGSGGAAELERGDDEVDPLPQPAIVNTNVIARAILGACTNSSSSGGRAMQETAQFSFSRSIRRRQVMG